MFSRSTTASIHCSGSGTESSLLAVPLDAPIPSSRRFRRFASGWDSGSAALLSASPLRIEIRASVPFLPVRAFGPVAEPTMPSADFCRSLPPPPGDGSSQQTSSGTAHSPSRLCPPHLRANLPDRVWTLKIFAFSSSLHASYAVPVRRASALPAASFRFHLAVDTLAVRLTIPPVRLVGDLHSEVSVPCGVHKQKGPRRSGALWCLGKELYQLIFKANWNCRGSSDAVGCPAEHTPPGLLKSHSGLTSALLFRFSRLNMSVMTSRLTFSVR